MVIANLDNDSVGNIFHSGKLFSDTASSLACFVLLCVALIIIIIIMVEIAVILRGLATSNEGDARGL